jgi:hypothetical protein
MPYTGLNDLTTSPTFGDGQIGGRCPMARILIKEPAANSFALFAAKLSPILGHPCRYNEAAEILRFLDDETLVSTVARYRESADTATAQMIETA